LRYDPKPIEVSTYQRRRDLMVALTLNTGHSTMQCSLTPSEARHLARMLIVAATKEAVSG